MSRLAGRTVATTRDGDPDDLLVSRLRAEGAEVLVWPTLAFVPSRTPEVLDRHAAELERYDWVVFTSARAVAPMADRAPLPSDGPKVAAVGRATAGALEERGWRVSAVGEGGAAELARTMGGDVSLHGARVLFPAGSRARQTLEDALASRGARVDRVEAYRTVAAVPDARGVRAALERGVDVVTFTSPSAVRSLRHALASGWPSVLDGSEIAAIGRTTARMARAAGLRRVTTAAEPSLDSLVDSCVLLLRSA